MKKLLSILLLLSLLVTSCGVFKGKRSCVRDKAQCKKCSQKYNRSTKRSLTPKQIEQKEIMKSVYKKMAELPDKKSTAIRTEIQKVREEHKGDREKIRPKVMEILKNHGLIK